MDLSLLTLWNRFNWPLIEGVLGVNAIFTVHSFELSHIASEISKASPSLIGISVVTWDSSGRSIFRVIIRRWRCSQWSTSITYFGLFFSAELVITVLISRRNFPLITSSCTGWGILTGKLTWFASTWIPFEARWLRTNSSSHSNLFIRAKTAKHGEKRDLNKRFDYFLYLRSGEFLIYLQSESLPRAFLRFYA